METPESRPSEGTVRLEETRYKSERETLAMTLDQIMNGDDSQDLRTAVWFAMALASRLDYHVGFDNKGYAHIWLPVEPYEEGHVVFYMGFDPWSSSPFPASVADRPSQSRGIHNRARIKRFSDAVLPPTLREEGQP